MGYKLIDTDRRGGKGIIYKVGIDEEQAEVVRFIFTEYARGTDKKIIADMLNAKGCKYKGKPLIIGLLKAACSTRNNRQTGA